MKREIPHRAGKRGSQALEMAFVMLPLTAILFLIMDISWGIFTKAVLQHSVREGVRYAITRQAMEGHNREESVKTYVQQNAMGFLNGPGGLEKIQITYFAQDAQGNLQPGGQNVPGNVVEVRVQGYQLRPLGPVWRDSTALNLTVRSADVLQ
jgi:Flp pilus assembly protein TadG